MQESLDLRNEFTKTFTSSHKRIRTQEVNGKKKRKKKKKKRRKKNSYHY